MIVKILFNNFCKFLGQNKKARSYSNPLLFNSLLKILLRIQSPIPPQAPSPLALLLIVLHAVWLAQRPF